MREEEEGEQRREGQDKRRAKRQQRYTAGGREAQELEIFRVVVGVKRAERGYCPHRY